MQFDCSDWFRFLAGCNAFVGGFRIITSTAWSEVNWASKLTRREVHFGEKHNEASGWSECTGTMTATQRRRKRKKAVISFLRIEWMSCLVRCLIFLKESFLFDPLIRVITLSQATLRVWQRGDGDRSFMRPARCVSVFAILLLSEVEVGFEQILPLPDLVSIWTSGPDAARAQGQSVAGFWCLSSTPSIAGKRLRRLASSSASERFLHSLWVCQAMPTRCGPGPQGHVGCRRKQWLRASRHEAKSQGSAVHQHRRELDEQREMIGTEPNLVQPLPLILSLCFKNHHLPCLSVSYLLPTACWVCFLVTRSFLSSFLHSHLVVLYVVYLNVENNSLELTRIFRIYLLTQ